MPRKTKEVVEKIGDLKKDTNQKETKANLAKKATKTNTKKETNAEVSKITKSRKEKESVTKKASVAKSFSEKTEVEKKAKKAPSKSVAQKTSTQSKTPATKNKIKSAKQENSVNKATKKSSTKASKFSPEYYDLPYKYNKTVVKILAQTPNNLFVYWEISDTDRENLKNKYGKYFFEITKPVLIIKNETLNYSFEIDIDDFANSWYINLNDSNCEYQVELGRRPIPINYSYMPQYNKEKEGLIKPIEENYIYISSSNEMEFPNDHILFNLDNKIYFRNIKTNEVIQKDITEFPSIYKDSMFANIYDIYRYLFNEDIKNNSIFNPSSRKSWFYEPNIFKIIFLSHDNI